MANFIRYSGAQDAAEVGDRLGNKIGAILMQLPQMRLEQRRWEQDHALKEQELGLMQKRYDNESTLAGAHAKLYASQAGLNEQELMGVKEMVEAGKLAGEEMN
jgi:hypothetical protein